MSKGCFPEIKQVSKRKIVAHTKKVQASQLASSLIPHSIQYCSGDIFGLSFNIFQSLFALMNDYTFPRVHYVFYKRDK